VAFLGCIGRDNRAVVLLIHRCKVSMVGSDTVFADLVGLIVTSIH